MPISWNQTLIETGIESIDNQHVELFNALNTLFDYSKQDSEDSVLIQKTIGFLEDYVNIHFRDEEAIQEKYSYPDIDEHKEQHKTFLKDFNSFKALYDSEGASNKLAFMIYNKMYNWLVHHICDYDKVMCNYVKSQMANG